MNAQLAYIYEAIQGYEVNNECIENETMCYVVVVVRLSVHVHFNLSLASR